VWVDAPYLVDAIGLDQVQALGLSTDGIVATSRLTQYELAGRGTVSAVMQYAGYTTPEATLPTPVDADAVQNLTNAFLRKLVASIILRDVYALVPGIDVSEGMQAAISVGLTMLDGVYDKKLPIPGMQPGTLDGYGGSQFNAGSGVSPFVGTWPVFRVLRGSGF